MTAPAAHSKWSASGFEQKILCPGSHVLQQGLPNNGNAYSAEGTVAHQVLTWALQETRPATAYLGRVVEADGFKFEVDQNMADAVQVCIDYVTDLVGDDGILFADIRVNYSSYLDTHEDEAWGTADVIVARGEELIVVDYKHGRGVEVSAEGNPQMSLYALGALQAYHGLVADFSRVRMAISQPRVKKAPSEYDLSVEELETWGRSTARSAVATCKNAALIMTPEGSDYPHEAWEETFLRPGEKQCRFCKAKATCPALRDEVANTAFGALPASPDEFADCAVGKPSSATDKAWLAACLSQADLIEDWVKSIRAEVERRLLAGQSVPGYKVVQGKRGSRQWTDPKEAEKLLRETFRLPIEKAFDLKLISPTSAEKLFKAGAIGPRQWPKAQTLIVQKEGGPHVAPAADPRPALDIRPVEEDFEDFEDIA